MTTLEDEFAVGQIRTDKKRKPTAAFLITRLYEKQYPQGNSALRAEGVICLGGVESSASPRDLDVRSIKMMFPHVLFNPPIIEDNEDK